MADDDHVGVTADDADGVFHLLAFDLRGEARGVLGGEHSSAQPVHGGFKEKRVRVEGR